MGDIADVPPAVVGRLRVICGELPEAYEEPAWIGLPEEPAPLEAELTFAFGSESIALRRPVAYKWTDPVLGERYRHLEVLPPVTVDTSTSSSEILTRPSRSRSANAA